MISPGEYFRALYDALQTVSAADFEAATAILDAAYAKDRTIFVAGNGQSATTASAFALDLAKQSAPPEPRRRFRLVSLSDNIAALTAWGNDVGYEVIFTEQLKSLFRPGDVLLAISVSGSSPNVVHAAEWMREHGGLVVAMVGCEGGRLHQIADASVLIRSRDYGHVETGHLALLHYWVDRFRERLAR